MSNLDILLEAMKADAHECNRRMLSQRKGSSVGQHKIGADGKPVCTTCGGPVAKDVHGHWLKTCSPECQQAARKRGKTKRHQVIHK